MIWYFIHHPHHYWVPALTVLVIMILGIRFFGHHLKGENRLFREPFIIFGCAVLWPISVMGLLVALVFRITDKVILFLIRPSQSGQRDQRGRSDPPEPPA